MTIVIGSRELLIADSLREYGGFSMQACKIKRFMREDGGFCVAIAMSGNVAAIEYICGEVERSANPERSFYKLLATGDQCPSGIMFIRRVHPTSKSVRVNMYRSALADDQLCWLPGGDDVCGTTSGYNWGEANTLLMLGVDPVTVAAVLATKTRYAAPPLDVLDVRKWEMITVTRDQCEMRCERLQLAIARG